LGKQRLPIDGLGRFATSEHVVNETLPPPPVVIRSTGAAGFGSRSRRPRLSKCALHRRRRDIETVTTRNFAVVKPNSFGYMKERSRRIEEDHSDSVIETHIQGVSGRMDKRQEDGFSP